MGRSKRVTDAGGLRETIRTNNKDPDRFVPMTERLRQLIKDHKRTLQGVVSLAILLVLIWRSDVSSLVEQITGAPLVCLIPWAVCYKLVALFVGGNANYCLFRRLGVGGYWQVIATSFKLEILAMVVPGRVGDLGMLYFLRHLYTYEQSAAVFLVNKLITLFVASILGAIGLGVFFSWHLFWIVIGVTLSGLGLFFYLLNPHSAGPRRWVRARLPGLLARHFAEFSRETAATLKDVRGVLANLILTVFFYLFAGVSLTLVLFWFGERVDLRYVVIVQAITQLAVMVPLTFMGLGLSEAIHVVLFERIGVSSEVVLSAMLSCRVIDVALNVVIYLIWMHKTLLPSGQENNILRVEDKVNRC